MDVDRLTNEELAWQVGIHMTYVISGVLFGVMDRISAGTATGYDRDAIH
jgi:uncharacterized membrane protein YqhA